MSATRELPILRLVFVLLSVGLAGVAAQAKYSGGSGTAKDPWRMAAKNDLLALAAAKQDYASHFILTADIDLSKQTYPFLRFNPAADLTCDAKVNLKDLPDSPPIGRRRAAYRRTRSSCLQSAPSPAT